jgi:glucokinase
MSINLHGDVCNCGNLGCVESEASTWALPKIASRYPDFSSSSLAKEADLNFGAVFNHAKAGDRTALAIQEHTLKAWSLAIINLIHAYDPERIVIGGGIMKSKDLIIPHVERMIRKDIWINDHVIELVAAEHVEYAGILGMCHLVRNRKGKTEL